MKLISSSENELGVFKTYENDYYEVTFCCFGEKMFSLSVKPKKDILFQPEIKYARSFFLDFSKMFAVEPDDVEKLKTYISAAVETIVELEEIIKGT